MSISPLEEILNDPSFKESMSQHSERFNLLTTLESIIIRGHILIEHELNCAIEKCILYKNEFKADKFSFSQKILIANMLGITKHFKDEIILINKLRNQIAHSLSYDSQLVDSIINRMTQLDKDLHKIADRSQAFARVVSFICGGLAIMPYGIRELQFLEYQIERLKSVTKKT